MGNDAAFVAEYRRQIARLQVVADEMANSPEHRMNAEEQIVVFENMITTLEGGSSRPPVRRTPPPVFFPGSNVSARWPTDEELRYRMVKLTFEELDTLAELLLAVGRDPAMSSHFPGLEEIRVKVRKARMQ